MLSCFDWNIVNSSNETTQQCSSCCIVCIRVPVCYLCLCSEKKPVLKWFFLQLSSVIFNLLYSEIPEDVNPAKRINYINDWINYYKSHNFLRSDSSNNHFSAVKSCSWLLFTLLINLQISRLADNKGSTRDDSGFLGHEEEKNVEYCGASAPACSATHREMCTEMRRNLATQ